MRFLSLLAVLIASPAHGQITNPSAATVPTEVLDATRDAAAAQAVAAVSPSLCPPANSAPSTEMVGGSAGVATTCARSDFSPRRISRTATCTIPTGGSSCTAPWDSGGWAAGTDLRLTGDPAPINATAAQPIQCNATALTVTAITIKCWIAQTSTVSILGSIVNPFSTSTAGTVVQAVAIPRS